MPDPDDSALTEVLQRPTISIADEDQAFGTIVARARTRVRRRRLTASAALLVVVALVGAVVATSRHADDPVRIATTPRLAATDVTFSILRRPVTTGDALPLSFGFDPVDPSAGSRLAISAKREQMYVYKALPTCNSLP